VFFRFRIASSLPYGKKLVDLERERTSAEIGSMAALLSVHVRYNRATCPERQILEDAQ